MATHGDTTATPGKAGEEATPAGGNGAKLAPMSGMSGGSGAAAARVTNEERPSWRRHISDRNDADSPGRVDWSPQRLLHGRPRGKNCRSGWIAAT